MIEIDGSIGGGQILRTSLSLSALSKKPFRIFNIRSKRENSGLKNQHLTAINAIAKVCNAKVNGNELNSKELDFFPDHLIPGNYKFDIGTAGSTILVLQTLMPVLIFSDKPSVLEINGGTANPLAPPALDIREVFLWHLNKIGIKINLEIEKEGFFPRGGGNIKVKINPCEEIKEFGLQHAHEGHYEETQVFAVCSKELEKNDVAKRMITGFKLNFPVNCKVNPKEIYLETLSPGCYIHANYFYDNYKLGMSVLGERSKKAEDVGKECAINLLEEIKSGATADYFTADQLLIYMAIRGSGKIRVSHITDHIKTNIETIEKFLAVKFIIEDNVIKCKSIDNVS